MKGDSPLVDFFKKLANSDKNSKKWKINNNRFRRFLAIITMVSVLGISFVSYSVNDIKTKAVDVFLGDEYIGVLRTEEDAQEIYNDLKENFKSTYDMEIVLDKELGFKETNAKDDALSTTKEIKLNIQDHINVNVTGYELVVDSEGLGIFKSSKEIEYILDSIKSEFLPVMEEQESEIEIPGIEEVSFLEEVDIVKRETRYSNLGDVEETIAMIREGKEEMRTHIVEVGESYWIIARMYDTTVEELIDANPGQDTETLQPGDEVNLFVPVPLINVKTVEKTKYTEETDFETEVQLDDSMYKNKKNIVVKGKKGLSEIIANEIKNNGILIEKEIIEEKVIEAPVTEVIVQGTKELPKTAATGSFMVPTSGRLTSPFGMRGGYMHRGIDLANSTGTNIYASDGGKVTFAGYKSSYGYLIEINHENGYVTKYAHASKLLVKSGERVYRGQLIAKMGSTGRSTGSHLHFEVLLNGAHKNPTRYIY